MSDDFDYHKPTSARLDRDYIALALGFIPIRMCPSGRPTPKNMANCAHCGIDLKDPDNAGFCGQPVGEDGVTPQDMSVARRIMRESMARHGEA